MKYIIILFITCMSYVSYGQSVLIPKKDTPQVLSCQKYQHIEFTTSKCIPATGDFTDCVAEYNPRCVDDIHVLTEKEWQDLQTKLLQLDTIPTGELSFYDTSFRSNCGELGAFLNKQGKCEFSLNFPVGTIKNLQCNAVAVNEKFVQTITCTWDTIKDKKER